MPTLCNSSAHCSTMDSMASLPSSSLMGVNLLGYRGMGFPYSAFLNGYSQDVTGPEPSEAAQMLQPEPQPEKESASDMLMRLIHPVRESLSSNGFVEGAGDFFKSIGDVHVASVEVDGNAVYHFVAGNPADFTLIRQKVEDFIRSRNEKVREIRLNVFGKNDFFFLDIALLFRPVHSSHEPGLTLAIGMNPVSLHAREGESFEDVSSRNSKLMTEGPERTRFLDDCKAKSQDVVSDLSHHISMSFPGVKLKVLTEDESLV